MGFFREAGDVVGAVVGFAIGGPVKLIGQATGSTFIEEIGDGAMAATRRTGTVLGEATEGLVTAAAGVIDNDNERTKAGLAQSGGAVASVAKGLGQGLIHVGANAVQVVDGALSGDKAAMHSGVRELAKTGAIAMLSVGIVDVLIDDVGTGSDHADDHFVDPHQVSSYDRGDGTHVAAAFRDGDGNPATQLDAEHGGGWWQKNPQKA